MDPATYRRMLEDALAKEPAYDGAPVLTLVGSVRGLGARGEAVTTGGRGTVRLFTRADVIKMLARLDEMSPTDTEE